MSYNWKDTGISWIIDDDEKYAVIHKNKKAYTFYTVFDYLGGDTGTFPTLEEAKEAAVRSLELH